MSTADTDSYLARVNTRARHKRSAHKSIPVPIHHTITEATKLSLLIAADFVPTFCVDFTWRLQFLFKFHCHDCV